jgi:hypothetical protein
MFGWLSSLVKPLVSSVSKFAQPLIKTVGSIAKPLWGGVKKVAQFLPGGEELTSAVEGIGSSLMGDLGGEAEGAYQDARDAGEAIEDTSLKNYRRTRDELKDTYGGLRERGGRVKGILSRGIQQFRDAGRQFGDTVRSKKAWSDTYAQPDDEEEEEYASRRYKARQSRRQRRRGYDDE